VRPVPRARLLRGHVGHGAQRRSRARRQLRHGHGGGLRLGRRRLMLPGQLGQPEVHHLDPPSRRDHEVGRLDVAVHDVPGVRRIEGVGDLNGEVERFRRAQRLPVDALAQGGPFQQFHRDEGLLPAIVDVIDGADAGWLSADAACASRWKRSSVRGSRASPCGRNLSATVRFSFRSSAFQTTPIPPSPTSRGSGSEKRWSRSSRLQSSRPELPVFHPSVLPPSGRINRFSGFFRALHTGALLWWQTGAGAESHRLGMPWRMQSGSRGTTMGSCSHDASCAALSPPGLPGRRRPEAG